MSAEVVTDLPPESSEARKLGGGVGALKPGGGGGGGGGTSAPLGPRPERVYSYGLLLELKDHPLARQWPPYLDPAFKNSRGVWDPDRWHLERKRGETPVGGETKDGPDAGKEGRKVVAGLGPETEDLQQLVLSPQRRSFLGGCSGGPGAPGAPGAGAGGAGGEIEVSLRPEPPGSKRVGSGRLIARQEEERAAAASAPGGGPGGPGSFRRLGEEFKRFGGEKFNERGFRRDRDDENWGEERRREGFYQHDERRDPRKNLEDRRPKRRNEPEWMNETISHHDFIELRGFEDPKAAKKKEPTAPPANQTGPQSQAKKKNDNAEKKTEAGASNKTLPAGLNNVDILSDLGIGNKTNDEFNFDAMMELMNSGNIMDVGGPSAMAQHQQAPAPAAESRFSKFFNKGSEPAGDPDLGVRRGSIQDELLGSNILKEINGDAGPVIKIPTPTEEQRYFAPISPAAQTRAAHNPIVEMINKSGHQGHPGHAGVKDLEEGLRRSLGLAGGHHAQQPSAPQHHQAPNVEELFKQFQRGHNGQPAMPPPHHQMIPPRAPEQQQDSMSAFKKLVAAMGPTPDSGTQGLPFGPGIVRPNPLPVNLPSGALTEQEILEQMAAPRQQQPPKPPQSLKPSPHHLPPAVISFLAGHPLNMELITRPEGKQLLMGLESGNINIEHLVQQLNNPALQQRQRDVVLSVLKLVMLQRQGHDMVVPGMGQPSRLSPLIFPPGPPSHLSISPTANQQRVPSPQEMTVLTQHIMQQALIKKKLEEQRENFRKRHGDAPVVSAPVTSGSPLAFTPTSVMRKNAAERKDSDPQIKALPELKITPGKEVMEMALPTSPGRAIIKTKEEMQVNFDIGQRRPSPQMFPPGQANPLQYLQNNLQNNMVPVSHSMLSQANAMAQQQLAVSLMAQGVDPRHLAGRLPPAPPRAQPGPPAGPLARFFSPEVLAQAQSGAVPAMPPMPQILPTQQQKVLTLEEIERQAAALRI